MLLYSPNVISFDEQTLQVLHMRWANMKIDHDKSMYLIPNV